MTFTVSSGLMEACVLAILSRSDAYGYILTQRVKDVLGISESTLYPVLRRLEKETLLTTYDQAYQGRNRRYYRISALGGKRLAAALEDWVEYREAVEKVLYGGEGFGGETVG